jgi:hypothetical protein
MGTIVVGCSPTQYYEPAAPQGKPPTKELIADNISKIFSASSNPNEILVSVTQPAVEGGLFGWLVCVRARITSATGQDAGFQTVVVFFQRQEIVLRRRAEPQDKCEGFESLNVSGGKK